MHELTNTHQPKRLYIVEFLRVFFVYAVIFGHCMLKFPDLKANWQIFFNSDADFFRCSGFAVECFFIIAGFFLYDKLQREGNTPQNLIIKMYIRLAPPLIFLFLLCVLFTSVKFIKFTEIVTLTIGMTIPGEVIGWGDWYVGVYFWIMSFYIGLFLLCPKQAWLVTLPIVYFTLCLQFNAKDLGWMKTYHTFIGTELIRGIYSIAIGLASGFIAHKLKNINKGKIFFTIVESYCLIKICLFLIVGASMNILNAEILMAILLILISHSYGYVSYYLNNISFINIFSKYTYSIFLMHIFPLRYLVINKKLLDCPNLSMLIVVIGGTVLGIMEYHLIEQKLVPYLKKYFKENS